MSSTDSAALAPPVVEAARKLDFEAPSLTVLVARRVRKGAEESYRARLCELCELLQERPGFEEIKAYYPGEDGDEWKAVLRFADADSLKAWQDSPQRKAWLESVKPLEAAPPRAQILTGLEGWFALPSQEGMAPPPKPKMAFVTWLGIFPTVLGFSAFVLPLLESWPLFLRCALMTAFTVPTMTWVVMPRLTRLFSGFLYPEVALPTRENAG